VTEYRNKNWQLYIYLLVGYLTIAYVSNKYIFTDTLFYNSYATQLTAERIAQILSFRYRFTWLGYLLTPLTLLIRIFLISLIFYTGTILSGLKVEFKSLFRIALQAEFVLLFAFFIKMYWVYFFMPNVSLKTIAFFQPLSIINFFSIDEIPKWFVYPLQLINLFEISYWLLLAYLLEKVIKRSFWKSFEFVLGTYGVALLIWAVFVIFLTLNFT
jgi:hypothetical protein